MEAVANRLDKRAARSRAYGLFALLSVAVLGIILVWLFLGNGLAPSAFIFGETPLGDPNAVLGSPLPTIVARLVERVGAVIVGIFLIQVFLSFCRYFFRVAEHLNALADAVRLSGGDVSSLKEIGQLFLPSGLDFGKFPRSPVERVAEELAKSVSELAKLVK